MGLTAWFARRKRLKEFTQALEQGDFARAVELPTTDGVLPERAREAREKLAMETQPTEGGIQMKQNYISYCRLFVTAAALSVALSLAGCVGMAFREWQTDDIPFADKRQEIGPVPANKVRVWILGVGGGPQGVNTTEIATFVTFNQTPFLVAGDSYFYVDLEPGELRVTTSSHSSKICTGSPLAYHCKPGDIRERITATGSVEHFVRIKFPENTLVSSRDHDFNFELVDLARANSDAERLVFWNGVQKLRMEKWTEE